MTADVMTGLTLDLRVERFPYHQPFRIAGHVFTETALLVATLSDGRHEGRGEGAGVYYLGDDIDHMLAEATRVRPAIEGGATRADLQHLLPPAARATRSTAPSGISRPGARASPSGNWPGSIRRARCARR